MECGAESACEMAVGVDDLATDHGGGHCAVVAVDHACQAGASGIWRFGIVIAGAVEAGRVDDGNVGAVAFVQVPGVEAVPVGEFPGEPMHGGFNGHEVPLVDAFEHPHPEVVERHVAQMSAGVGEADLNGG